MKYAISIEEARHATPTQVIRAAYSHLKEQGKRAVDEDDECVYRLYLPEGRTLACGVGGLLPEEIYLESMEGATYLAIRKHPLEYEERLAKWAKAFPEDTALALADIQKIHDESGATIETVLEQLRQLEEPIGDAES